MSGRMQKAARPLALWAMGLRGTFLMLSLGLHGLAFAAFLPHASNEEAPVDSLELSIAPPQGETLVEEKDAVDSTAQSETVASVQKSVTPPPDPQEVVEAAKVDDPDAEVMTAAVTPPDLPPPPQEQPQTPPEPVHEVTLAAPNAQQVNATEETFARHAVGVETGLRTGGGTTRAAYAAAVKKEIARNKKRPTAQGAGAVSVSFVIGPAGEAESISVVKSVNPALDETARSIIAAVHLPPPPGGKFLGTIAIKFE